MLKTILLTFLSISFFSFVHAQQVIRETIIYLNSDGKSFKGYTSIKTGYPTTYTTIPKEENPFSYYQYIFPNTYRIEQTNNKFFNKIHFQGGDYSMIIENTIKDDALTIDEDGVYTYKMVKKEIDGHYGLSWNSPNNSGFTELAYVWIIPEQFEFVSYSSNRNGEWVERDNSLSFFGSRVNDVLLEIKYRKKSKTPEMFQSREVKVKKKVDLDISNNILKVRDNGQEDGDIISISLNGEWIAKGLKVSKNETELILNLRKGNNYLIMYAENEGDIPPNTAAMRLGSEEIILNSSADSSEALELFVR